MHDPPGFAAASTGGSPTQRQDEQDYDQIDSWALVGSGKRISSFQTKSNTMHMSG